MAQIQAHGYDVYFWPDWSNSLKTDILHWPVYLGNNNIFFTVQHVQSVNGLWGQVLLYPPPFSNRVIIEYNCAWLEYCKINNIG